MAHFPQLSAFRGGNGIVRVIGHRGARDIIAENTMEGFEFTLGIGVKALEIDVVLTADGVPVITHNHQISTAATRGPDGQWLTGEEPQVAALTFQQLQQFDVGGVDGRTAYGQRFPDQAFLSNVRIPALTQLLQLLAQPAHSDVSLMLEIKSDPVLADNDIARADLVRAVVQDVRKSGLEERTLLHSFDWGLLDECRRQAPDMPTSYLSQLPTHQADIHEDSPESIAPDFDGMTASLPQTVADAGGQLWCPYFADVTPALVDEAHALGLVVSVWTVNARNDIYAMIDAGVDGIVSDHPGRVQRCLLERGLHWLGPE